MHAKNNAPRKDGDGGASSSVQLGPVYRWREGAPANRATRLEGLKHSPPLHATHLTGTVSGLPELSLERPLSTTNITLPARARASSLPETRLLH